MKVDDKEVRSIGQVNAVQGPVVDIKFNQEKVVPELFEKVIVNRVDKSEVFVEVTEHLPGNVARCIAINSTDLWVEPKFFGLQ